MKQILCLLKNRLKPADLAAKNLTFDERSFDEPSRCALRRALQPKISQEEEAAAKRMKLARMIGKQQGMPNAVELTKAVYTVADLFLEAKFPSFLPCQKNTVNVDVGDVVVYQQDGDVPVTREVLCVALLKSVIVCPASLNKIFFCSVYGIHPEEKCFKAEPGPQMKVPYEHMRVRLLKFSLMEALDGNRIILEDFDLLPPHKFFH